MGVEFSDCPYDFPVREAVVEAFPVVVVVEGGDRWERLKALVGEGAERGWV